MDSSMDKNEESAILRAAHGQHYAKILMLFRISVSGKMHDIAFIQDYNPIPDSILNEDDHDIHRIPTNPSWGYFKICVPRGVCLCSLHHQYRQQPTQTVFY